MEKRTLTLADVEAQSVLELPSREMMGWLVTVVLVTGDITVLSFNDITAANIFCNNVNVGILQASGFKSCHGVAHS